VNLTQRMQLHDYNIVVEAAMAGQGIAMGRHRLIFRSWRARHSCRRHLKPHWMALEPDSGWSPPSARWAMRRRYLVIGSHRTPHGIRRIAWISLAYRWRQEN
jgi:DNA-binding transcriptional LysR family regulator